MNMMLLTNITTLTVLVLFQTTVSGKSILSLVRSINYADPKQEYLRTPISKTLAKLHNTYLDVPNAFLTATLDKTIPSEFIDYYHWLLEERCYPIATEDDWAASWTVNHTRCDPEVRSDPFCIDFALFTSTKGVDGEIYDGFLDFDCTLENPDRWGSMPVAYLEWRKREFGKDSPIIWSASQWDDIDEWLGRVGEADLKDENGWDGVRACFLGRRFMEAGEEELFRRVGYVAGWENGRGIGDEVDRPRCERILWVDDGGWKERLWSTTRVVGFPVRMSSYPGLL
ncbi:hypothetical protein BJ508DRAFT_313475 [Ascobolus immersus RN42]|uniref:Uncharacterized protein n=1 Tax=Ascobolus immersus RN42 TaxID=1160509 RepID=A0A3N4HLJ5_ASCIM|nr:hypothetical protein BJ508DRAFT_313475 [Ascobolus immersus RN42]